MQSDSNPVEPADLEALEHFRLPGGQRVSAEQGVATRADVSSVVGVASHTFDFRENSNTPGRFLEQSVVVNVPSGAGWFTSIARFDGAFTNNDFQFLTERPFGQFWVHLGLRGNNLVCQVRLTDSNQDDPILVRVTGLVVFYQ